MIRDCPTNFCTGRQTAGTCEKPVGSDEGQFMTNNLRYIERIPTAAEFQELRTNAGWGIPPESALKDSLAKTIFGVCVEDSDGTTIGMGRLVGDGGIQVFITDVIVHKHWQNRGIGKQIMKSLMKHVENVSIRRHSWDYFRPLAVRNSTRRLDSSLGRMKSWEQGWSTFRPRKTVNRLPIG